jgi:apolipoprotein N-acyltransferase
MEAGQSRAGEAVGIAGRSRAGETVIAGGPDDTTAPGQGTETGEARSTPPVDAARPEHEVTPETANSAPDGFRTPGREPDATARSTDGAPPSAPGAPVTAADPEGGPGDGARRGRRLRVAVMVVAGLALAAAFPPFGIWPLAPIAVGAFSVCLVPPGPRRPHLWRRGELRSAAWLGMVFGLAFCFPSFEGLRPIGWDAWIALSLFEALYFIPLAVGIVLVSRLPARAVWIAGLWIAEEALRGRFPFGGFPWARLAFSQSASPFTGYASLGSAPLVSFVTALAGGLLAAAAVIVVTDRHRLVRIALPVALLAIALGVGGMLVPRPTGGRPITVAVIQGNVPHPGMDFLGRPQQVLNNHANETHKLAAEVRAGTVARPDLVIWPENSSDLDPYTDPAAHAVIDSAVRDIGVPVLVGAVITRSDGDLENRGIAWSPTTGPGDYYVKRHPLPFGEYIPIFRNVLQKFITRFDRVGEFVKGKHPGLLQLGPTKIGDVICFEVAYDGIVRDVASAPLLVVQTNNASFANTTLPSQQFAMSRMRAVEHGRSVIVASTSGISGIIAPDGHVLAQSGQMTPAIQVKSVPLRTSRTLADRLGSAPEWVLALIGIAAAAVAVRLKNTTLRGA